MENFRISSKCSVVLVCVHCGSYGLIPVKFLVPSQVTLNELRKVLEYHPHAGSVVLLPMLESVDRQRIEIERSRIEKDAA